MNSHGSMAVLVATAALLSVATILAAFKAADDTSNPPRLSFETVAAPGQSAPEPLFPGQPAGETPD
jgi:hypothetical protein